MTMLSAALLASVFSLPHAGPVEPVAAIPSFTHARFDDTGNVFYGADRETPGGIYSPIFGVVPRGGLPVTAFTFPEHLNPYFLSIAEVSPSGQAVINIYGDDGGSGPDFFAYTYSLTGGLSGPIEGTAVAQANNGALVLGYSIDFSNGQAFGIRNSDGTVEVVTPPNGFPGVGAAGANSAGTVVGYAGNLPLVGEDTRAIRYTNERGIEFLPDLPFEKDTARRVNEHGDIIAQSSRFHQIAGVTIRETQSFVISADTSHVTKIEPLPYATHTNVSIIDFNDHGIALGSSNSIVGGGSSHILYVPGLGTLDLGEILLETGLTEPFPIDLNNYNELLVLYDTGNGLHDGLAIVPVIGIPAPGSAALIAIGTVAMVRRRGAHVE